MSMFDRAYGAVIGAYVGDAAGAPLEFAGNIDDELVSRAMKMQGGGLLKIGKGQITDDSELAMCQVKVLKDLTLSEDVKQVASKLLGKYREWADSDPFDIGNTTTTALRVLQEYSLDDHLDRVARENAGSKANGALMRITPLAVWSRNLPKDKMMELVSLDTRLTHPNQSCVEASIAYTIAIQSLISDPDPEMALANVDQYLDTIPNSEVTDWIRNGSVKPLEEISVRSMIGFVKWAIILSFYHLRNETPYEKAIRQTLFKGGDTDTNAAIVGGMVGALHGASGVPKSMRENVISYQYNPSDKLGYSRPEFLSTNNLPDQINSLFEQSK